MERLAGRERLVNPVFNQKELIKEQFMSKTVDFSTKLIIGGRPLPGSEGKTFETINPANGKVLASVAEASGEDVDKAVSAARKAFEEGHWSKMAPAERKKVLLRFATVIEAHSEELAMMEAMEAGKPITDCLEIDMPETVNTIRWHAEAIDKLYDQISPSDPSILSMIVREPMGVVAAILPWNFPAMMAAWKLGPILATGNTVVLKPAEQTSLSTIRIGELAAEAGIPDGVINVVCGFGETVGKALGEHPDVDCVAFTGSTETGRMFLRYSADTNLKRVLLECGGKNPFIVMGDTEDLDTAADHATNSIFWNMGENCSSNSRLLVHQSIKDELIELIVEKAKEWVVGDPLDATTKIGPMIEQAHLDKVMGFIDQANQDKNKLVIGGKRTREDTGGYFVQPTIFDNVKPDMTIAQEEIFGPVLSVIEYETDEEAIEIANGTDFGLAGGVFTKDLDQATITAGKLEAGQIYVNSWFTGSVATPFGGYKQSGYSREKGQEAIKSYLQVKNVGIQL